jgi:GNAT superfamily N-acetyltransferase
MIRLGVLADLPAATHAYSSASLSNTGDRDNLLAQAEHLILGPEGLAQGRTYVAEEDGSLVGFATRIEADGTIELEDLFVHPRSMRRVIATALVDRIAEVLRARGGAPASNRQPSCAGFCSAVGFIDCSAAETDFGATPRMVLAIR